jgi:acetyl esterase/lipase
LVCGHFVIPAGHSLGGGVAALVTLLLQQPGAAPHGASACTTVNLKSLLC